MALPESRRRKLQSLLRSLAGTGRRRAAANTTWPGGLQASGRVAVLEDVAAGSEQSNSAGTFWRIRRRLAEVCPDDTSLQRHYSAVLRGARQRFDELAASPGLCRAANGTPEDPLFLDIESCGLAGSCVFLVGLMSFRDGELTFEQLLARHYGEEPAVLAALAQRLGQAGLLVTFNGKAFDMTCLRERAAFHGVALPAEPTHLDILHEARRRWRGLLPDCRLVTLERWLCRRHRLGDIPGSEVPDAYHRFVTSADARALGAVLHHNLLDLLTMGQLLCLLLTGEQPDVDS